MAKGRRPVQQELNDKIKGMSAYLISRRTFTGVASLSVVIAGSEPAALDEVSKVHGDDNATVVDRIREVLIVQP